MMVVMMMVVMMQQAPQQMMMMVVMVMILHLHDRRRLGRRSNIDRLQHGGGVRDRIEQIGIRLDLQSVAGMNDRCGLHRLRRAKNGDGADQSKNFFIHSTLQIMGKAESLRACFHACFLLRLDGPIHEKSGQFPAIFGEMCGVAPAKPGRLLL